MDEQEVREAIRTAIRCSGGVRKLAKSWGISPAYLSDCANGRRGPGDAILRHFGLRKVVTVDYVPDGSERPGIAPVGPGGGD